MPWTGSGQRDRQRGALDLGNGRMRDGVPCPTEGRREGVDPTARRRKGEMNGREGWVFVHARGT
jgi:hypothetical protein